MATGDSMIEGFASSSGVGWTNPGQGEPEISAEDIAWADSCLTKDVELSENDWNSFKDALLETINYEPGSSTHENDGSLDDVQNSSKTGVENATRKEEAEPSSGDSTKNDEGEDFWSRYSMKDVFLPTYNEDSKDLGIADPEMDLAFKPFEMEQSTDDIFRIWELDIPQEEDELVVKLKKALAESSLEPTTPVPDDSKAWKDLNDTPVPDDSKAWKDLNDTSLDDLVSGIADLSL